MKNTIAKNMQQLLQEQNRKSVWYGDTHIIEECALRSRLTTKHPLRTIQSVLNALDRSKLFEKKYIIADISGKPRRYRCFVFKNP